MRNYDSVFKEAQHIVHLNLKLRMADIDIGTIRAAIEIVKQRQGHPKPTEWQINTVTALVKQNNSVNQSPHREWKNLAIDFLAFYFGCFERQF